MNARTAALRTEGLSPEAARYATRNFRLGVANGVIFGLVDGLLAPGIVLALFINRLGAPNVLVGLLPAIMTGGWFLPQMLVATRVQGQRRMMHWYTRTSVVRTLAMLLLAVLTVLLAAAPGLLLVFFFLLFSIYAVAAGVTGIPWLEIVSKVIPPRRRGSFFSLRSFWGSVLALLASGFVAALLSERLPGLRFPYNFALLFGIVAVLAGSAMWSWASIKEPESTVSAPPVTLKALFKRGREALSGDREYRAFTIARILLALATISDPFYAVYARTVLGAPTEIVGLYLAASSGSSLLSNFLWGPLGDRANNRTLLTLTVLSVALVPLSAIIIPLAGSFLPAEAISTLFALVFVLGGLAVGSSRILNNNMLLSIAPARERAVYIGFLNTVLGLVMFVPPLGGVIVDTLGFTSLFVITLVLAASAMLASTRMSTRPVYEDRG